jgi:uncharacterized protein
MHVDFPFHVDGRGRSATTTDADHVRDMIEQLVFTVPGERVNRPDFGTGALRLVFAPSGPEVAGAVEYVLQAGLQQWLADDLDVDRVEVVADEGTLRIAVDYRLRLAGAAGTAGRVVVERRTGP